MRSGSDRQERVTGSPLGASVTDSKAKGVYFDNNATTPLDSRVFVAMLPWLQENHGNPSSVHRHGQAARHALEMARRQVALLIEAEAPEVVFTGSGTEANNAVIHGLFEGAPSGTRAGTSGAELVISSMEHPSIDQSASLLEARGFSVARVAPAQNGVVEAEALLEHVSEGTRLVCLMLANNELGTLQPVREVAAACQELGVPVLCDAVQAVGKIPVSVQDLGVSYLTLGAHKFYGPLGAAALYVADDAPFEPLLFGGGQERRRRASTENTPAIVGLGAACELAKQEGEARETHLRSLRDHFEAAVSPWPETRVHCQDAPRLPHTSNVAFLGSSADTLVIRLDLQGFAVSTGAACASGVVEPSRTLLAMGLSPEEALSTLRISFGIKNQREEIDAFVPVLRELLGGDNG